MSGEAHDRDPPEPSQEDSESAPESAPESASEVMAENDRWLRIGDLFDRALEVPAEERSTWLADACADDPELRREVASMLSAHDRAEGILEHSVPAVAPTLADRTGWGLSGLDGLSGLSGPGTVAGEEVTGREVGPYRLQREIGRGGMGVVFQARDGRLDRDVAIKFLPASLAAHQEAHERFLAEARAASALDHPAICTVYDLGETDDGQMYIAMAFYPGQTLAALLADGPLPVDLAVRLARQVAEGLGRAHEAGIIHRDVKPSNLLVTERDEIKILDFGVAKLEGGAALTRPGALVGTLSYMSPEQFTGDELDRRSDLWSLGAVMYEMIAGRRPFEAAHPAATLAAILGREPTPLEEAQPEVPAAVAAVVHRLLAKEPARRYGSAAELVEDLKALEREIPVPDRPPRAGTTVRLPLPMTHFVGREEEVRRVRDLLAKARLVTLTGPGGTGKTRLALEVARRAAGDFPDGAYFVSLSSVTEVELVASTVASALEVTVAPGRTALESIQQKLADREALLVLDNFEHVVRAAPEVAELLMSCRGLRILVTSRVALRLSAEQELPVSPLPLPDLDSAAALETLAQSPAVQLFVERASAARPDFELTEDNVRTVAAIVVRLDGLPLALELAAARIKLFPPKALLERLGGGLDLLSGGARDLPDRHRTLRRALGWSYELLDEEERRFFRRLSVLVDEVALEAAEAVCADLSLEVTEGLTALVEQSLLQQKEGRDGAPRFSLLGTVRAFGLEKLREAGEEEEARRAHATWCVELAERAEPELTGADQGLWLDRLEEAHGNLRAALDWAEGRGEVKFGLRLGTALWRFWLARGHIEEGAARLQRLLESPCGPATEGPATAEGATEDGAEDGAEEGAEEGATDAPSRLRARALNGLGTLCHNRGDNEAANTHLSASLALFRELEDASGVALVLNNLAWVACELSQLDKARRLSEEALELDQDRRGLAVTLNNLGWIANYEGDTKAACRFHGESLELRREIGDQRGIAFALGNLAWAERMRGRLDEAEERLEEAQELAQRVGDPLLQGFARLLQVQTQRDRGETEEAAEALEHSLALWRRSGNRSGVAWALTDLGHLLIDRERWDEAESRLDEAIALWRSVGGRWGEAKTLLGRARLAWAGKRPEDAWCELRRVLEQTAELGTRRVLARALEVGAGWLATDIEATPEAGNDAAGRSARALAAAEALREELECPLPPVRRAEHRALVARLRRALGGDAYERARQEGRDMGPRAASDLLVP